MEEPLREAAQKCAEHFFSVEQVSQIAQRLLSPDVSSESKADFLAAFHRRGETAEELAAFADAFLEHSLPVPFQGMWNGEVVIDCCGTGGGGLNWVNISTGVMFVLAACGVAVVKHGNRGMTKRSGSADVLEALGGNILVAPDRIEEYLNRCRMVFLFAPRYHPAFASVSEARRILGARGSGSIFNLLGPLLNPIKPHARLVGVFKRPYLELLTHAFKEMQIPQSLVVHGEDKQGISLGEVAAHGKTAYTRWIHSQKENGILWGDFSPSTADLKTIEVSSAEESARQLVSVFQNKGSEFLKEMLIANAAAGLWTIGKVASWDVGKNISRNAIESGATLRILENWRSLKNDLR